MSEIYPWHIYEKILDERICDVLLEYCNALEKTPGLIHTKSKINLNYRKNLVGFFPEHHWMMGVFHHYATIQNFVKWKYDLGGSAPIQYAEYSQGHYYKWHADSSGMSVSNVDKVRKITCILQLTDGSKFEGGDLELRLGIDTEYIKVFSIKEMRNKGSLIVFPSSISHRVTEIDNGTRKTLTGWILGMPFK